MSLLVLFGKLNIELKFKLCTDSNFNSNFLKSISVVRWMVDVEV